jgi:hypothetical protein
MSSPRSLLFFFYFLVALTRHPRVSSSRAFLLYVVLITATFGFIYPRFEICVRTRRGSRFDTKRPALAGNRVVIVTKPVF